MNEILNVSFYISTVTAGGHAHAHDPRIDIMRMSMNSDLGIFAPHSMRMRMTRENPNNAHAHVLKICNFKDNAFAYSFF